MAEEAKNQRLNELANGTSRPAEKRDIDWRAMQGDAEQYLQQEERLALYEKQQRSINPNYDPNNDAEYEQMRNRTDQSYRRLTNNAGRYQGHELSPEEIKAKALADTMKSRQWATDRWSQNAPVEVVNAYEQTNLKPRAANDPDRFKLFGQKVDGGTVNPKAEPEVTAPKAAVTPKAGPTGQPPTPAPKITPGTTAASASEVEPSLTSKATQLLAPKAGVAPVAKPSTMMSTIRPAVKNGVRDPDGVGTAAGFIAAGTAGLVIADIEDRVEARARYDAPENQAERARRKEVWARDGGDKPSTLQQAATQLGKSDALLGGTMKAMSITGSELVSETGMNADDVFNNLLQKHLKEVGTLTPRQVEALLKEYERGWKEMNPTGSATVLKAQRDALEGKINRINDRVRDQEEGFDPRAQSNRLVQQSTGDFSEPDRPNTTKKPKVFVEVVVEPVQPPQAPKSNVPSLTNLPGNKNFLPPEPEREAGLKISPIAMREGEGAEVPKVPNNSGRIRFV